MVCISKRTVNETVENNIPPLITLTHLHEQIKSSEKNKKGKKDKSGKGKNGHDAPPMATSHHGEGEGEPSPTTESNNAEEEENNDMMEMNESGGGREKNSNDNAGQGEKGGSSTVTTGRPGGKEEAFWCRMKQFQNRKKRTKKTLVQKLMPTRPKGKGK